MATKTLQLKARIRMVSRKKGLGLTPFEDYETTWVVRPEDTPGLDHPVVLKAMANTELRKSAVTHFVKRLMTNRAFQRQIGGTVWSVDVHEDAVFIDYAEAR